MEAFSSPISNNTRIISVENVEGADNFNSYSDRRNEEGSVSHRTILGGGLAVIALAGGLTFMATRSGGDTTPSTTPSVNGPGLKGSETLNGGVDCVTSGQLYKNIAETNTPSTEAIFQSLANTDKNGNQTLISQPEAVKKMREQVCGSTLALATIATIQELRAKLQAPGQNILNLISQKADSYATNPTAAIADEKAAYNFLAFLTPTENFPIVTGNATRLVSGNNQKTEIAGQLITGTNNFNGFEISFNEDDSALTPEQKAINADLQKYVLINADGTVVFNNVAANYTVTLNPNEQPVNATPNTNNPLVTVGTNPNQTNSNGSSSNNKNNSGKNSGNKTGETDTQNTTGGGGSSSSGAGNNEGNNTGSSLNNSGTTGSGPGNGGGGNNGGGETGTSPTTPGTTPETIPPTTTPATTPETTPPTTAPSVTTTTGTKSTPTTVPVEQCNQYNPIPGCTPVASIRVSTSY